MKPSENGGQGKAFRGYRRRVRIAPKPGCSTAWMEDDLHHFGVEVAHDGRVITKVTTHAPRHPWSTCEMAGHFLEAQFRGVALADADDVEDQRQHCTHLYDLVVAAARHALDDKPVVYDIRVADAVKGVKLAELDGRTDMRIAATNLMMRTISNLEIEILGAWKTGKSLPLRTYPDNSKEAGRFFEDILKGIDGDGDRSQKAK